MMGPSDLYYFEYINLPDKFMIIYSTNSYFLKGHSQ